ncbi:MAG: Maf family protein [Woeseiaceae bacterium]|nr:Maf family protein [Woeseiaceae bacterium]
MTQPSLILASSSPRRREILTALGLAFDTRVTDVDETPLETETPVAMVLRLAEAKALAAAPGDNEVVVGADTAVILGEQAFGKPVNEADALGMLAALSGRVHRVATGVAVATAAGVATAVSETDVRFREIHPDEARRYWHSGEPRGKAGAYAIQGLGGAFVEAIMGSYTGVVGLPVYETARLLAAAGLEVLPTG